MSKIALITGTSGDIGIELALTYLQHNYIVIGLDKNAPPISLTYNFTHIDCNLKYFSMDKSYRQQIKSIIDDLIPENTKELILINNAAIQIIKNISDISWSDWEDSMSINVAAPFFLSQYLKDKLIKANGHILSISSIHSRLTKKYFSCYAASKSALESLTRSLALELSDKGVSVNAIAPAAIETKMLIEGFNKEPHKIEDLKKYHPAQIIGSPKELAIFVKSITDQKGGFLTGSILEFHGGIAAKLSDPN